MKKIVFTSLITISLTTSYLNAGLIGKAWDHSVSETLKEGCVDLTANTNKLDTSFLTIIMGMAAKVYMLEVKATDEELEDNEAIKDVLAKILTKGCKGGLMMAKDKRFNKFTFTEKVRYSMQIYTKHVLNKR